MKDSNNQSFYYINYVNIEFYYPISAAGIMVNSTYHWGILKDDITDCTNLGSTAYLGQYIFRVDDFVPENVSTHVCSGTTRPSRSPTIRPTRHPSSAPTSAGGGDGSSSTTSGAAMISLFSVVVIALFALFQ